MAGRLTADAIRKVSRFSPKGVSTWRALAWILLSEANRAFRENPTEGGYSHDYQL
jgi:hypothetical protein